MAALIYFKRTIMKTYNKSFKASAWLLSFFIFAAGATFSQELSKGFHEYTLENGMKVFVLEDFSSAPVRVELSVRAGFSAQTPKTAGFFPLYAKLFPSAGKTVATVAKGQSDEALDGNGWTLENMQSECNADCARYIITTAPMQTEKVLEQLSYNLFSPIFSDTLLQKEFSELKTSVLQNAFSTAGFINSSIDSRIFATEPWKQDSGIYPSIFTNTPIEEARTILTSIGQNYYTPQNCALFISGGITADNALALARKYFLQKASLTAGLLSDSNEKIMPSPKKKFVLHDSLFTPEMAQIVIQYKNLSMEETDIAAASLNEYNSALKKELTEHDELAIRGQEYINAASAHKNGSSRLIIQSLLEKNKASPVIQAETFLKIVRESSSKCSEEDFNNAKKTIVSQYRTQFKNSSAFMDLLSQYWAIGDISQMHTENVSTELLEQPSIILNTDCQKLVDDFQNEEPFVFVLVNSTVYKQNAKKFKEAGYEEVTSKNGSWFSQKLYDALKKQIASDQTKDSDSSEKSKNPLEMQKAAAEQFAKSNKEMFSSFRLSNEIPVVVKRNGEAATAVISLAISGGQLSSARTNPGLSEVMTNALARNIQKDISEAIYNRKITGDPEVLAETKLSGGIITVECLASDVLQCLSCISHAIIYENIKPAEADGFIYDRRSQHRIQQGNPEYQMFAEAVKLLYKGTDYPLVYSKSPEILSDTQYTEILASYPGLLDASKYSLVLTGNIPEDGLETMLEESFGVLINQSQNTNRLYTSFPKPDFKPFFEGKEKNSITIQIDHQFFTDLSADKAGARPEILVPTTEFLDPVQFWIPSPAQNSPDFFIFNALVYELEERLSKALSADSSTANVEVKITPANAEIQAAVITFINVRNTSKIDEIYKATVLDALNPEQNPFVIEQIKDRWILHELSQTQTNRGTALLIRSGLEQGEIEDAPVEKENGGEEEADTNLTAAEQYITEYERISSLEAKDFLRVAKTYILEEAPLRLYSKDSKK